MEEQGMACAPAEAPRRHPVATARTARLRTPGWMPEHVAAA